MFISLMRSRSAELLEGSIDDREYGWIKLNAGIAMTEEDLQEDNFIVGKARSRTQQAGVTAISSKWKTVVDSTPLQ